MDQQNQKYYIGLDCGTSSVGWAVTDEKYNLLKANGKIRKDGKTKTKSRTLWGVRLFDEADTAAERRGFRSARRRNRRAKDRLKLLRMLFREEMLKVDPEFYKRLKESFYYEEDKHLKNNSKNTLFNDPDFTDQDFHKKYPTIWHLRQAIINADEGEHFDLRLYFLAIQHILKHRGHFLLSGEMKTTGGDFQEIFDNFFNACENAGYRLDDSSADFIEEIVKDKTKSKLDKKKELKDRIFIEGDETPEDATNSPADLAGLLVGSKVSLTKIFGLESDEDYKYSFAEGVFEDKLSDIENSIGSENLDLIFAAKQIYDYGILRNLLGEYTLVSDAMVANYDQHQKDLKELKDIFKSHHDIYKKLFQAEVYDDKFPSYNLYIGKAYTWSGVKKGKNGAADDYGSARKSSTTPISQEDFNKHLKTLLEENGYTGKLLERAEKGELLPKQRGQAKGTIPQQLHHNELEIILQKLAKDYPSFAVENTGEDEKYNTKCKKIAQIHSFRIPYYCGPLVKRKYDDKDNPVAGGKSQFSWADEEICELVRPWNFDALVNKDSRAQNFIRRMTNECTYLLGEDVLPKSSLLYQKYMVLNELNNLRINGQPLDINLKQEIFERAFRNGELSGNITLKRLTKWLKDNQLVERGADVSGTSEVKTLPKLKTYQDFHKILGDDFEKKYSPDKLEKVIESITILGEEKEMLERQIINLLSLDKNDDRVKKLAKLSYKDWGKLSAKFLNGITVDNKTILDWLWESQHNLQQLLGQEIGFEKAIDDFNNKSGKKPQAGAKIKYSDVQNLYCSPAVKRSVWQTIKIVDELTKVKKSAPAKIFIEVTRGEDEKAKGKYTLARKKDLETKLKAVKSSESQELLDELSKKEDRDLQSKKLFLYFSQMGKCAYSGEPINLEEINNINLYDIDHIYPRSKTKDDSITRNLVLVKAKLNRDKTNKFLYEFPDWQNRMRGAWKMWKEKGLITKEKYERLVRATPLTIDELGGFIARQIVETSQTVKAIRDLLQQSYPDTKVILVKAGQVSDFRHMFANGQKYKDSDEYRVSPKPEFIKIRELNDYHHAKDAYLNIVVGNVMNSTFTSNPYEWIKKREDRDYSINPERIFRDSFQYQKANGETSTYPETKAWDFAESIKLISDIMKRNDIMWTRMSYIESSEISDLQIVGKTQKIDGILPIKQKVRLSRVDKNDIKKSGVAKYGGYNSVKGAHFALIECRDKKGELQRRIVSIPQIYKNNVAKYVRSKYNGAKVIIPVIQFKVLFQINNFPLHLAGKSSGGLILYNAKQLIISDDDLLEYLKKIIGACKKLQQNPKYIFSDRDGISEEQNAKLLKELCNKLKLFVDMPSFQKKVFEIRDHREDFNKLDEKTQAITLNNFIKVLKCNAETGDISTFVPKSSFLGKPTTSEDFISTSDSAFLINQSPTGLYEEHIDLKTVQPKPVKKSRNI